MDSSQPASQISPFFLKFWGTRGSIPCAGPQTVKYGGNTSCVEVRCGDYRVIFDAGSGLPMLGRDILQKIDQGLESTDKIFPLKTDLFLTHAHLDHIIGLPFFPLFHIPDFSINVYAGHLLPQGDSIHNALSALMKAPLFPVPPDIFAAHVSFHDFEAGDELSPLEDVLFQTMPLNHPNGATGYRLTYKNKSVCYITDIEHDPDNLDQNIVNFVRNSDVMIYDATYTDEEYPRFVGFGHSTWQEAIRIADAAHVEKLFLFHHEPRHTDIIMDRIAEEAAARRPDTFVAREGMTVSLIPGLSISDDKFTCSSFSKNFFDH